MIRILFAAALLCAPTISFARDARILPHPAGCPRVLFCGCGAAVEIFGKPIRDLFLSTNWLRFPRAEPSFNKVAVRRRGRKRGHVFVLKEHVKGDDWWVYDANSGGGKTRMHIRSIRGYVIVNPAGSR